MRGQLAQALEQHAATVRAAGVSTVDAKLASWLNVKTETVATGMAFLQSVVLESMGALLWAVALPRQRRIERKPKAQEVRIKHIVPYCPQQRPATRPCWHKNLLPNAKRRPFLRGGAAA